MPLVCPLRSPFPLYHAASSDTGTFRRLGPILTVHYPPRVPAGVRDTGRLQACGALSSLVEKAGQK